MSSELLTTLAHRSLGCATGSPGIDLDQRMSNSLVWRTDSSLNSSRMKCRNIRMDLMLDVEWYMLWWYMAVIM